MAWRLSFYGLILVAGGLMTAHFGFWDHKQYGSWVHYDPNPVGWLVTLLGVVWVAWSEIWERKRHQK